MNNVQNYLSHVLGIHSFLSREPESFSETASFEASIEKKSVKCSFIYPKKFSLPAQEMLTKMVQAMGLSMDSIQIFQDASLVEPQQLSVEFLDESPSMLGEWHGQRLYTFSPEYLLKHPEQKKQVWGHLQQVIKKIN